MNASASIQIPFEDAKDAVAEIDKRARDPSFAQIQLTSRSTEPLGRPRYVLPERRTAVDPRELLDSILGQFGHRVSVAQNLVVLQSELGSAPAIARALDRVDHPLVVGTLAGDDTVLVIARSRSDARALAAELAE